MVLQAADPAPFPELGKADTRSGKGAGSVACEAAPERPESTPIITATAASPSSIPLARRMQRHPLRPAAPRYSDRNIGVIPPRI
jgi:hypothetical protein